MLSRKTTSLFGLDQTVQT